MMTIITVLLLTVPHFLSETPPPRQPMFSAPSEMRNPRGL